MTVPLLFVLARLRWLVADVFLSYRNTPERREYVERLRLVLDAYGISVWWDYGLEAGKDYEPQIMAELAGAGVVIPLWCEESTRSEWVKKEAQYGLDREKLLPARLQAVRPPDPFEPIQAQDLIGWDGAAESFQIMALAAETCRKLGKSLVPAADKLRALRALAPLAPLTAEVRISQRQQQVTTAWGHVEHSLNPVEYEHFLQAFGSDKLGFEYTLEARRRIALLSEWRATKESDYTADLDLLDNELFPALRAAVCDQLRADPRSSRGWLIGPKSSGKRSFLIAAHKQLKANLHQFGIKCPDSTLDELDDCGESNEFSTRRQCREAPQQILFNYVSYSQHVKVCFNSILYGDGAFQRTLAFRGPDLDSATLSELMGQSVRLNNALRRFGSGWCLHMEARRRPSPGYPDSDFAHALAWLIDEERRAVFESSGARFESDYFLTLSFLPPPERQGRLEALLFEGGGQSEGGPNYPAHLARFLEETDQLLALLQTLMPAADWLGDAETLGYLHDCVSDRRLGRLAVPPHPFHLDALLTDAPLLGGLAPKLGARHLKILSVRSFVAATEPGLLDALNRLPVSYRWVTRFLPLDREEARREIEKLRKRWFSKRKGLMTLLREALFREEAALQDNDAANQAADADAALQELGADAVAAGFATLTITVAEENEAEAEAAVRLIRQVTDGLGFVTEVESVNAVEAWLGSLPGQAYADVRRPVLLTPSLAHLLPTSAVWAGAPCNAHLARFQAKWKPVRRPESAPETDVIASDQSERNARPYDAIDAPPLLLAATDGATPFRLNLHVGDVGHTLVLGPTGAGKSVLLATLAAQWLRYAGAQVYLFDKGRSARATILGLGGDFFDLGSEHEIGFQPLADIDDADERAWALDWLTGLIASENLPLTPELKAELWRALELLAERPRGDRTLSLFLALVQEADRIPEKCLAVFRSECGLL